MPGEIGPRTLTPRCLLEYRSLVSPVEPISPRLKRNVAGAGIH